MAQVVLLNDVSQLDGEPGWGRSIGPYVLASMLRAEGLSCVVIDHFTKLQNFFEILESAVGPETLFVGFSGTFLGIDTRLPQLDSTFIVDYRAGFLWCHSAEELKDFVGKVRNVVSRKTHRSDVPVVLGGVKALYGLERPEIRPLFDFFVIGKAESFFLTLVTKMKLGEALPFSIVDGAKYLTESNFGTETKTVQSILWERTDAIHTEESLPIEIAKGCLYNCKFCHFEKQGSIRQTNEALRAEMIRNYEMFGTTIYQFCDDCFNDTRSKVNAVCETLLSLPFKIEWVGYARVDVACKFPETLDLMIESGARGLFWGIESLNAAVAKRAGKGTPPEMVKELFVQSRQKHGDRTIMKGSFIIGLPGESEESISETLDWVITSRVFDLSFWPVLSLFPYSEKLDKVAIDYADYSRFPEKYGFETVSFSPYYWKHSAMDFPKALKIQRNVINRLKQNGMNKSAIGSIFQYPRLRNLGMDHEQILAEIRSGTIDSLTHARIRTLESQWIKTYEKNLCSELSVSKGRLANAL